MRCSRAVPPLLCALACAPLLTLSAARAQDVNDLNLHVERYLGALSDPTGMRFFAPNEGFLIEKGTNDSAQVKLFNAGSISTVLTLNVKDDSERGLLGIALDPAFTTNHNVYLYYSAASASGDWAGNQLAKYQWNSQTQKLTATTTTRTISSPVPGVETVSYHNGGPLVFGSDGNLYGITGDLNRNGVEQNNKATTASSQVGGIYRLNTNLAPAAGNPFGGSFDKWYAYGVRNSFGLAVDPVTHKLWDTENGDLNYDEINLVEKGMNSGWRPIQGPDSSHSAPGALNMLPGANGGPGAFYSDPEFSFLNTIAPTSIQFLSGSAWGPSYDDAVVVGDANTGQLYLLRLNANRTGFVLTGNLADLVADPLGNNKDERDALVFGRNFGVVTDMQIGPDGALYVTSFSDGSVFRIAPVPEPQTWAMLAVGLALVSALGWRRGEQRLSLA